MLSWFPKDISTFGPGVDSSITLIVWIVGAWFILAEVLLFFFLFRFRKRDGVRASWLPGTGKAMAWILVPIALVGACDLFIEAGSAPVWAQVKEHMPRTEVLVKITGSQFMWRFNYADAEGLLLNNGVQTVNDLYVPAGKVVGFKLQSTDVIHSFSVPSLRLKQDAVPGRVIPGWFEATATGDYPIVCSELCGVGHTMMQGTLHVLTPAAYQAWMAKESSGQGQV